MIHYTKEQAFTAAPKHDRSHTFAFRRSEAPNKMAFANELPATQDNRGRFLRKPAGSIIALIFEMLLCVVALCFIALALAALSIKDRPTGDSLGATMEQAMKLGPTIYPILFAALLSRSLKSIGRYFAQKSVRMSTLWALMNTNATADPILHLFSMPTSVLVWGLLTMWAMSPLGGQSSIRLLYKTNLTQITTPETRYWDNGPLGALFTYQGIMVDNDGSYPLSMRDIYVASLMQSVDTKASPLDQWGNIKIPRIDAGNVSVASPEGWMPVKRTSGIEAFTSLFGMPVVGLLDLKKQGDLEFSLESTYIDLVCSPMRKVDRTPTSDYEEGLSIACEYGLPFPETQWFRSQRYMGLPTDNYPYYYGEEDRGTLPIYKDPVSMRFNSSFDGYTTYSICEVTQHMVESFIECVDGNCAATKVRPSTTDHRNKNYTIFDYWGRDVLDMISGASQRMNVKDTIWGSSSSELFLNDSQTLPLKTGILGSSGSGDDGVNMSLIDPGIMGTRASILLNTGLQAFMAPTAFAGGLSTNLSVYGPPHIPAGGLLEFASQSMWDSYNYTALMPPTGLVYPDRPFMGASTNVTLKRYIEVYRPDYPWVIVLIVSSILLFVAGVAGISVRLLTMAPNIFDPVIGLTYGNPYLPLPDKHDNPIDADERASLFRSKKVQFGHVEDDGTAKAVFGEAAHVEPLRLGVPYH